METGPRYLARIARRLRALVEHLRSRSKASAAKAKEVSQAVSDWFDGQW